EPIPTLGQEPGTVLVSEDPFEFFNRVVMAICDEETREATAKLAETPFQPIPLLRESRRMDRKSRFETAASNVFQAAVAGGIPREEAEVKVKAVSQALEILIAEPWWQRLNIGDDHEKEAAAKEMNARVFQAHEARQAVFRLGLMLRARPIVQPEVRGSVVPR